MSSFWSLSFLSDFQAAGVKHSSGINRPVAVLRWLRPEPGVFKTVRAVLSPQIAERAVVRNHPGKVLVFFALPRSGSGSFLFDVSKLFAAKEALV
ncbi:hypothetical protein QYF36_002611 [Acer negundo]|nr:hypothetical protein QYF36_002611 [Acer negundo]